MSLVYVSWNLLGGGLDAGLDSRLRRQMAALAELHPKVVALQECTYWDRDYFRIFHRAEQYLGLRGYLSPSGHHGCHRNWLRKSMPYSPCGWGCRFAGRARLDGTTIRPPDFAAGSKSSASTSTATHCMIASSASTTRKLLFLRISTPSSPIMGPAVMRTRSPITR